MKLKEICHSRTGDKGDISNVSLIPWNESDYELIKPANKKSRLN